MTTLKDLQRKLNEADNAVEARLLSDAATIRTLTEQKKRLLAACMDAEAALQWEDPYNETRMSREERIEESLAVIRAAIAATK